MATDTESKLHELPTEIIEQIARSLSLADLTNFRLTCRDVASRTNGPTFRSYFETRTTDLSAASLDRLAAISTSANFKSSIKKLTVLATIYDNVNAETIKSRAGEDLGPEEISAAASWIQKMQREQEKQSADGNAAVIDQLAVILKNADRLETVDLSAAFIPGPNQSMAASSAPYEALPSVWRRLSQVLSIATAAMTQSNVRPTTPRIYPKWCCGAEARSITRLMSALGTDKLAAVAASVRSFALTFTPTIMSAGEMAPPSAFDDLRSWRYTDGDPIAMLDDNFEGVPALLQLMPQLKSLDLAMYNTLEGDTLEYDRIMTDIARHIHFPDLQQCALRGLRTKKADLLRFLANHASSICRLELRHVALADRLAETGESCWHAVFPFISSMPKIEFLRLSGLIDEEMMVNLAPVGTLEQLIGEMPSWNDLEYRRGVSIEWEFGYLVSEREFDAEGMQKGLVYDREWLGTELNIGAATPWTEARRFGVSALRFSGGYVH
ncbi:hypothetical protein B0T17DRAFT_67629 [Bombardia bombarda]|uniref:F-box domain-containing protein n=1 Tax=Bombardia bombarda TaxID=252184 RepID=A0AA39XL90_9PEZI|nr:hypothetical protein B0T17DRAFT_67629 [Bombardia bombarda]